MKITITPAILPEYRHIVEKALADALSGVARLDGGGTETDGTECDIFLKPKEGFTEADVRTVLTGQPDDPPWPLPKIPYSGFPTEIPVDVSEQ